MLKNCRDLSIIIPARNEEFLRETVADILKNKRANTEIIVGCDGNWPDPGFDQHPDVILVYYPISIGQRAIANRCVGLSSAKYIMKVDAHCAFDEGFDQKMIDAFKETGDDVAMVPNMRNLWVFDWKCYKCGLRVYQDKPNICPTDGSQMRKKMLWHAKGSPNSTAYCFDPEPHFQYHGEQKRKQTKDIDETMSLQGSCFMCTRENYLKLNVCDESLGSWGSQGIEVACKFWLSGRRVLCNRKTWYAHCFRTKENFGFPYEISGRQVQNAKKMVKDLFFNQNWPRQVKPVSWLVEKFSPVPGWTPEILAELKKTEALKTLK